MDERYYQVFRQLSRAYRSRSIIIGIPFLPGWSPYRRRATNIVYEAIQDSIFAQRMPLRPDALHFLLVNFCEMVALPLSDPEAFESIRQPRIRDGLRSDVRRLVEAAVIDAEDRREVSAANVIRAAARELDHLKIKEWRLWEKD